MKSTKRQLFLQISECSCVHCVLFIFPEMEYFLTHVHSVCYVWNYNLSGIL